MKKIALVLVAVLFFGISAFAAVNCDRGDTITAALASLNRSASNTLTIRGTCTEVVLIEGFQDLTLVSGKGGAVIQWNSTNSAAVVIRNSRTVILRNLTVRGTGDAALFDACQDCKIYSSTIESPMMATSLTKVLLFKSVVHANGWAGLGIFDNSVGYINDCTLDSGSIQSWAGVFAAKGAVVTIGGTTFDGFQQAIVVDHATVDLAGSNAAFLPGSNADQTVLIENSWGNGITIGNGGTASLTDVVRLRNNGATWWGSGIAASANSTLGVSGGVEISNSFVNGILVDSGSHATISAPARILNSGRNGIQVSNNSTVGIQGSGNGPVQIVGGSTVGKDIVCDETSLFGGAQFVSATTVECPNFH